MRDHEQKPGGEIRQIRGYKDKERRYGRRTLSLTGKAHGRAVTRWWKGAGPERGKSCRQTNATQPDDPHGHQDPPTGQGKTPKI